MYMKLTEACCWSVGRPEYRQQIGKEAYWQSRAILKNTTSGILHWGCSNASTKLGPIHVYVFFFLCRY